MVGLLISILYTLPPRAAAHVAAWLIGAPEIGDALERVCERESRCERIGVHGVDKQWSRPAWLFQTRRRHRGRRGYIGLRAWCQTYDGGGWGTRGAFGLNAAAHWQFMPPCYQAWWFDVPIVSALVSAAKWRAVCAPPRKGWCGRHVSNRPVVEAGFAGRLKR